MLLLVFTIGINPSCESKAAEIAVKKTSKIVARDESSVEIDCRMTTGRSFVVQK
jgi:hypothetical protein